MGVHAPDATIEKNLPDASADRRGNIAGTTDGLLEKYQQIPCRPVDFPDGCTIFDLLRTI